MIEVIKMDYNEKLDRVMKERGTELLTLENSNLFHFVSFNVLP